MSGGRGHHSLHDSGDYTNAGASDLNVTKYVAKIGRNNETSLKLFEKYVCVVRKSPRVS